MRTLLTLAVLFSPAVAAPVPTDGEKEEKFEGVWKLESKVNRDRFVDFSKQEIYMSLDSKGHVLPDDKAEDGVHKYRIDREKKWFDYVNSGSPDFNLPAIYEMEGDTLKVCSSIKDKNVRPDKVASGPGVVLETWKRIKPKEKK